MALFASILRRLGYVQLRDYNLRRLADGTLVPIDSRYPVPVELPQMQAAQPPPQHVLPPVANQLWPQIPQLSTEVASPASFAEGTADGLEPVPRIETTPMRALPFPRRRSVSDTIPEPAPPPRMTQHAADNSDER